MDLRKGAAVVATNLLAPFRWGENIRADSPAGSGYLERRRAELPDRLSRYPSFEPDSEALTNTGADRCEVTPISRVPFHDPHLVEHQSIRWRGETEMRGALTMATLTSGRAVTAPWTVARSSSMDSHFALAPNLLTERSGKNRIRERPIPECALKGAARHQADV